MSYLQQGPGQVFLGEGASHQRCEALTGTKQDVTALTAYVVGIPGLWQCAWRMMHCQNLLRRSLRMREPQAAEAPAHKRCDSIPCPRLARSCPILDKLCVAGRQACMTLSVKRAYTKPSLAASASMRSSA